MIIIIIIIVIIIIIIIIKTIVIMQGTRLSYCLTCADPESFVRWGPNLITFFGGVFLADEGKEDPNVTMNGPSSAHQRNAI